MPLPDLYFLGGRNYVQGASVLRFALLEAQKEMRVPNLSDLLVRRFKQIQELDSPAGLLPDDQVEPANSLRATLALEVGEESVNYKIIAFSGSLPRLPDATYAQTNYREIAGNEAAVDLAKAADFWEVLKEVVQLTKVFHINKYNRDKSYRFIVGGFEKLKIVEPLENRSLNLKCKITKHVIIKKAIYNQALISVEGDKQVYSFIINFIGKEI